MPGGLSPGRRWSIWLRRGYILRNTLNPPGLARFSLPYGRTANRVQSAHSAHKLRAGPGPLEVGVCEKHQETMNRREVV